MMDSLLDSSSKKKRRSFLPLQILSILFVCLIAVGCVLGVYFVLGNNISQLQSQLNDVQSANAQFQSQLNNIQAANAQIQLQNELLVNQTSLLVKALLGLNVTLVSEEISQMRNQLEQFVGNTQLLISELEGNVGSLTALVTSPKSGCNLQCSHGGYPSADCSVCNGCESGWTGTLCTIPSTCDTYCTQNSCACNNGGTLDSTSCSCNCLKGWTGSSCQNLDNTVTPQERIAILEGLKNQALHAKSKNGVRDIQTIPGNVGQGVDMTASNIGLPVLKISVSENNTQSIISPGNTVYNIPDGVSYQEILGGFEWPVQNTILFETFYEYVSNLFQWSNQDGYVKPMFQGMSLNTIRDTYFPNTSFMVETQSYYAAYGLSLAKPVSSFQLDNHAAQAVSYISQLPLNQQNLPVFNYFFENWGTSVIVEEVQGGLLQFACILPSTIWNWGGQGRVSPDFLEGQTASFFRDNTQGTSFTSGVFTENSVCDFYCTGGNPENCPTTANAVNNNWVSTIWGNPQSVKYSVVPLSEVLTDSETRQAIQTATYAYYSGSVNQWDNATSCSMCLPTLHSFTIATNIPYNTPTTVPAGTCGTAIRVAATGACFYIMSNNGSPINGGTNDCDFKNSALWGIAAFHSLANPVVEWIVTDISQDNTFSSAQCKYPDGYCEYWTGQYSLFCV